MPTPFARLSRLLECCAPSSAGPDALQAMLQRLIDEHLAEPPLPGAGCTLERWRMLAAVAGHDVGLAKLYEGHTDALAILGELDGPAVPAGSRWGVWAAEPPHARLGCQIDGSRLRLTGRKAWCSGAGQLSHALVTAWDANDQPVLAAVALQQRGVTITRDGWHAVGMAATASVEVLFDDAEADLIGASGDYLNRPGFWQGGGGIAACWYGAAVALADALHIECQRRAEPHAMAHLGTVDTALTAANAVLQRTAEWIDANPGANAQLQAGRLRAVVEACVETVLRHVGRALGATPFCRDAAFARKAADLPVFIRQSHAERDLAALAALLIEAPTSWRL